MSASAAMFAGQPGKPVHRGFMVSHRHVGSRRATGTPPSLPFRRHLSPVRALPEFEDYITGLQQSLIQGTEELDGSKQKFQRIRRERDNNTGYGITAVMEGGDLIEKGASNITVANGVLSPSRAAAMASRGRDGVDPKGGQPYSAMAMSMVFHPAIPWVPTLRADVRMLQVDGQSWYGGGCDLTPVYLFEEDAVEFHNFWKDVCGNASPELYGDFKAWCDRYFYIPCREEHRGVGGIFFDDLLAGGCDYDVEEFVRSVGDNILESWKPIVGRRRDVPVTEMARDWQLIRRGRYIEFNLLYDRGVRVGLDSGSASTESIMVSAPPEIKWKFNVVPEPGSHEERTIEALKNPRDWASLAMPTETAAIHCE